MPSQTLDYSPPATLTLKPPLVTLLASLAALLLLTALFSSFPFRTDTLLVDPITGSTQTQTTWPLGLRSAPRIAPSGLESHLRARGIPWRQTWKPLSTIKYHLGGRGTGCAQAPPALQLRSFRATDIALLTDPELLALLQILQSGTPAQQCSAIDAAANTIFQRAAHQ